MFRWLVGVCVLLLAGCATTRTPPSSSTAGDAGKKTEFDFGFLASRLQDVNGDLRLRAAGPLFESATGTGGMSIVSARPFFTTGQSPEHDRQFVDYLWPVGITRTLHDENRWRFLIFYGFNHTTNDPVTRYRTWLMPFYFQGKNASGITYRALFPVGGTLKDFLGRDEITFVLFPLYSRSKLNDLTTHNALWPFISRTTSTKEHIYRARVFPVYGVVREKEKFHKQFILWPFFTRVAYDYPDEQGGGHVLFPLYGVLNLKTEKTWWILPPFFRFTDGTAQDMVHAPWPFYQRRVGAGVDQLYLWPLWGRKKIDDMDKQFFLWPFFWRETNLRPGETLDRYLAFPVFSHTIVRSDQPAELPREQRAVVARRNKFWPLYSYRREGEDSRFRFVELWPIAEVSAVERNWAPFWTLYQRTRHGENIDHEVLWGLFRHQERGPDSRYTSLFPFADFRRDDRGNESMRAWNVLKGLVGYERKGSRKTVRLLYFIRFDVGKDPEP